MEAETGRSSDLVQCAAFVCLRGHRGPGVHCAADFREAPAISQPAEPEPPASSAVPEPEPPEPASSSVESREEPQPEPGAGMKVPEGCRAEWKLSNGTLILMGYDPGGRTQVQLPTGGSYQIGASCFAGNETLTAVVFPADVTEIGPAAFRACSALKTADFSACRTLVIGNHAFEGQGLPP